MEETKKKLISGRFAKGLGIYALVLLAFIAAGLLFFWFFIRSYERTRPATIVKQYMARLDEDYLATHAQDFFASLDEGVQSRGESVARIRQAVESASYAMRPQESDRSRTYVLRSGDTVFDSITLTAEEEDIFGFPLWEVTQETFTFDDFCHETELTIPSDWSVALGGKQLGTAYIRDEQVPYALLREFYEGGYSLPHMVTYQTGRYVGELALDVRDAFGQPVDADKLREDSYADNCTEEEKAAIEAFVSDYVYRYVRYMGSHDAGLIYMTYSQLDQLVLSGSELDHRLSQVMGLGYSWSVDYLESVNINGTMNIGGGYYVCDATYYVTTKGHRDYVTTTNNTKLLMLMTDGGLRAVAQVSY